MTLKFPESVQAALSDEWQTLAVIAKARLDLEDDPGDRSHGYAATAVCLDRLVREGIAEESSDALIRRVWRRLT